MVKKGHFGHSFKVQSGEITVCVKLSLSCATVYKCWLLDKFSFVDTVDPLTYYVPDVGCTENGSFYWADQP